MTDVPSKMFPKPEKFGSEPLSEFMDAALNNVFASFCGKSELYAKFVRLDEAFYIGVVNISKPGDILFGLLLMRSHAAFKSACQLAMGGQTPEAYMLLRGCIEAALYALHIAEHPELGEVWLNRHDDHKTVEACRTGFSYGKVKGTLKAKNEKYFDIMTELYERTISFGGHPNERAITGNLLIQEDGNKKAFFLQYLVGDSVQLDMGLKTVAQVGACALHIAQLAYPERFKILGIDAILDAVTKDI